MICQGFLYEKEPRIDLQQFVQSGIITLYTEIEFWLDKTTWLQLNQASPYRLVEIGGQFQLVKLQNTAIAHGGFLTDENVLTQRIDFTQHCVSSYLQKLVDIDGEDL